MKILGIDPGSHLIGYGLIEVKNGSYNCLDYGTLIIKEEKTDKRLLRIKLEIEKIIKKERPDKISIEKLFFYKNIKTAMNVSECRGVIILTAAQSKIDIEEFTPLQVKQMVSGYGKAKKINIQKMMKLILDLKEEPESDDAADALALAICCANVESGLGKNT